MKFVAPLKVRQPAKQLLVRDVAGSGIDALQCQVKEVVIVFDTVIVDGRTNEFGRTGLDRAQDQCGTAGRQTDHRTACVVRDAYDV